MHIEMLVFLQEDDLPLVFREDLNKGERRKVILRILCEHFGWLLGDDLLRVTLFVRETVENSQWIL